MTNLGDVLRVARERRGDSIHEAATATGIAARYIAGLESEQFELLPARVYARAYLRNYADYLGLDPEPLLERLDDMWVEPEAPEVVPVSHQISLPPIITGQMLLIVVFLAMVGLLLGYVYSQYSSFLLSQPPAISGDATPGRTGGTAVAKAPAGGATASVQPAAKAPTPEAAIGPALPPVPPPAPTAAPTATPATPAEMKIEIRVTQKAWVNVEVDGKEVLNATLSPGDRYNWTAKERVFMWSGYAGGIQIIRNGVDEGPLGSGVVKMVWAAPTWKATPVTN